MKKEKGSRINRRDVYMILQMKDCEMYVLLKDDMTFHPAFHVRQQCHDFKPITVPNSSHIIRVTNQEDYWTRILSNQPSVVAMQS